MKILRIIILTVSLIGFIAYVFPEPVLAQDGAISDISFLTEEDDLDVDGDWDVYEELSVKDPYEKYNRTMFKINNKIYETVFSPLSKGYDFLIPRKIQSRLNNFFRLTATPKRFFNNVFQKKPKSAFIEVERLLINASLGIGGIFDPADHLFHLKQQTEDFGQTLGVYGADNGPYFIWPIIGPSTRRDTIGVVLDTAFSPFLWLGIYDVDPQDAFRAISAAKRVNNYSYNIRDNYERITEVAIDPYIALQHAYIQNRQKRIED